MTTVAIESGFVTMSDGASLHYLESGRGAGMVLIPGWMTTADFWQPQIQHFSRTYRVIALDPRSQGDSAKTPEGNCVERRARDIREVLDHLHLAPAVVVAWSMAVADVLSLAEQFGTEALRAAVLVDGPIVAWGQQPDTLALLVAQVKKMQMHRQQFNEELVRRLFRKPHPEAFYRALGASTIKTPTNTAVAVQIDSLQFDYRATLKAFDRPVMFVGRGESPGRQVDVFRAERPGNRVEILPESGHALFLDEPDRFNRIVEGFLRSEVP